MAKESISAAGGAASPASAQAHTPELPTTPLKSPALYLSKSIGSSSRSLPLAATTTKLHITSNATSPTKGTAKDGGTSKNEREPFRELEIRNDFSKASEGEKSDGATPDDSKTRDARPEPNSRMLDVPKAANESTSWLNWFSKSEIETKNDISVENPNGDASSTGKSRPPSTVLEALQGASASPEQRRNSEPTSPNLQQGETPRSWLSLWGNPSIQTKSSSSPSVNDVASNPQNDPNRTGAPTRKMDDAEPGPVSASQPPQQAADGAKPSYGWAFWSRDQPKSDHEKTRPGSEVGELALAGSSSQCKPESAILDEAGGILDKVGKRQRPQSVELNEGAKKSRGNGDAKDDSTPDSVPLAPQIKPKVDATSKAKRVPENLLLPSFRSTYSSVGRPSLIQQISRILQMSSPSEQKHVGIVQNRPRVKRALAIVSLT